jgi:alkylation response protein AidB-like acyl-CoA dehydrogenase
MGQQQKEDGARMDLTTPPVLTEFRDELGTWLDEHAPRSSLDPPTTPRGLEQHLAWERALSEAGYAAPGWPVEYGGRGMDLWGELVYDEEYVRRELPERLNKMALIHGGRTVMAHGTPEQRARWLPGILDCSDIWCQGFSEPEAGSDLAALRTTAIRDGDDLVLNGQKTWTSNGVIATRMYALVRTDPGAPRHRGISFVVFDLDRAGVDVRPITQLHGHAGFAEVFFTDVRIPTSSVVGGLNDGWHVAQTALRLERGTARGTHTRLAQSLARVAAAIDEAGGDRALVERLGSLRAWTFAYTRSTYALTGKLASGIEDGVAASINKLRLSEIQTAVHELYLEVLGPRAEIVPELGPQGELLGILRDYWHSRAQEIYAGSNEIQRNIIAEQGLGLPREARP